MKELCRLNDSCCRRKVGICLYVLARDTGTCFEFREGNTLFLFFCLRENKFKQIWIPNKLNYKAFLNMKFPNFQKSGLLFFFLLEMQPIIFLHLKQLESTQVKLILKYFQSKYITSHALSSKVASGKKLNNKKITRNSSFMTQAWVVSDNNHVFPHS